jgi:hypothetical protein
MQDLTRIAVRKNRLDGHPSDRNRITYAHSNPANRESASGACIHPQKNLPEEFLATRKARHRSGPAEVLQSASARSRLAEPEGASSYCFCMSFRLPLGPTHTHTHTSNPVCFGRGQSSATLGARFAAMSVALTVSGVAIAAGVLGAYGALP